MRRPRRRVHLALNAGREASAQEVENGRFTGAVRADEADAACFAR
jgi:hypothetical protein